MIEPRVELLSQEEAKKAAEQVGVPGAMAELSVFRVLLRQPKLAKRVSDLLMTLLIGGSLDARLRELIIMRIGWYTGSVYEWTQHWRVARQLEIPQEDLLAVRDWRARPSGPEADRGWSAADRVVLAATDETLEHGTISAKTWEECVRELPSAEEQIELVSAIGTWRMISQMLRSLAVPLEEGVAAWPPDGREPAGFEPDA